MICPRCRHGAVCKAMVRDLGTEVYACISCDALWTHPQAIGPLTFVSLPLFLQTHGLAAGREALTEPDYTWDGSQDLQAARAALEADPAGTAPRLHLAALLLATGEAGEALEHFAAVLGRDPANLEALDGGARAAAACGDTARAESYTRLLTALGAGTTGPIPRSAPAQQAPPLTPLPAPGPGEPASPARPSPPAEGPGRARLRVVGADDEDEEWRAERPAVTLADVAGMEPVKRRLNMAFLAPLRNPELRKMFGKSLRGGLLLYGPPGCGKTFIARATAGELGARFISVGLSDVLDMWLGESERKLHEIFDTARRTAPTVLFFDELDAIGQKRSQLRHHGGRNIVNQLLAELDGVDHDNDGVFVLGATNHPWDVDTALLRPGRLDRMVLVLPPDEPAREAILRLHLADRPAEAVDLAWLAGKTRDFSGADLAHLCESAVELALEESVTSGRTRPVTGADFKAALKEVRASTRPWFETARSYAMFANDGGVYDELLAYMRANKLI